jgi:hypothetical protein
MTWNWITGTGPTDRTFGPGSSPVSEMKNAPGINGARRFFDKKNQGKSCNCGNDNRLSVTNYAASFGLSGLLGAGLNPTQQFIGSYRIDIYPYRQCKKLIILTNTSCFKSFAYGIAPDWRRGSFGPMGNMTQYYWWVE